jgi:hypothetical protein
MHPKQDINNHIDKYEGSRIKVTNCDKVLQLNVKNTYHNLRVNSCFKIWITVGFKL